MSIGRKKPASTTARIDMLLLARTPPHFPVTAVAEYHSNDPFAVTMRFLRDGRESVKWTFARDLLIEGCEKPTGHGDVRAYPYRNMVVFELISTDGRAKLVGATSKFEQFLARTLEVVPAGSEGTMVDIDNELAHLTR